MQVTYLFVIEYWDEDHNGNGKWVWHANRRYRGDADREADRLWKANGQKIDVRIKVRDEIVYELDAA